MQYRSQKIISTLLILLMLALLTACGWGGSTTQQGSTTSSKPAVGPGQHLLEQAAHSLNTAHTLHGVFNGSINGQLINGEMNSEIWRMAPDRSRTLILTSTLSQFATGTLIVNDGKQIWQYDPAKKVVYSGQASAASAHDSSGPDVGQGNAQQLFFGMIQTIFTESTANLLTSTEQINGRPIYVIHVTPRSQGNASVNLSYDGTVALDQQTRLPVVMHLTLAGIGQVQITIPTLEINQPLATSLFAFAPPPGIPQEPFPGNTIQTSNSLTLQQAERQAGYHLLCIPAAQTTYKLESLDALGAPGNQVYAFTYILNGQSFTLSESKALANLHLNGSTLNLHSTTATLATHGPTSTLSWTEQGVGIQIAGALDKHQIVTVANLLK